MTVIAMSRTEIDRMHVLRDKAAGAGASFLGYILASRPSGDVPPEPALTTARNGETDPVQSSGSQHHRPVRLSGTVYCHKAGLAALDVLRQRWMVAGWTLKVLATSLMDRPSSTRERARVF